MKANCVGVWLLVGLVCLQQVLAIEISALAQRQSDLRQTELQTQGVQQEATHTTKTTQGVVTTHTVEFKNEERRVGQQENVYDDNGVGKNGEGGTSVILSNLNSVETWEDNRVERDLAVEAAKKRGEEQRRKEDFSNTQQEQKAKARQELDKENKIQQKQAQENRQKKEDEAERRRVDEHKKKREKREEESEKKSKQRAEQTQKQLEETAREEKEKKDKRDEQERKRREAKEEEEMASLRTPTWRVPYNNILRGSNDIPFKGAYTYMFFIRPLQIQGGWGNILHKGQDNVNRNPAIWTYPGQLRLHVRSGTAQSPTWYNGGNNGCDPERSLPINQWTHFTLVHDGTGMRVYYDAQLVCQANIGGPVENSGPLYLSDPWHSAALADLADFRYYPRAVPYDYIQRAYSERRGL